MILEIPNCPTCGKPARYVTESQLMCVEIRISGAEGKATYTGHCEEDGARVQELDEEGRSLVYCRDGHQWATYID